MQRNVLQHTTHYNNIFGFVRDKDKKPVVDVPTTVCALSKKKASLT